MPKHVKSDNSESNPEHEPVNDSNDTPEQVPEAEETLVEAEVIDDEQDDTFAQESSQVAGFDVMTSEQKKSRRMKRILIVVVILLIALIAALCFLAFQFMSTAQELAVQQSVQQSTQDVDAMKNEKTNDSSSSQARKTTVPDLTLLVGKTQDEVLKQLVDYGASATSVVEVNEEGNPIKQRVTIALTTEPGDSRSGTPTVYLGLNDQGLTHQAGYSTPIASLGYGSISYLDAVTNERIIEKTLNEAGLKVEEGTVQLPGDKTVYSTYASDGTTLVKEDWTFEGSLEQGGKNYTWSSVLMYNYTLANQSGLLADTVRQIYVYINEA